jgi:hypothetical protein
VYDGARVIAEPQPEEQHVPSFWVPPQTYFGEAEKSRDELSGSFAGRPAAGDLRIILNVGCTHSRITEAAGSLPQSSKHHCAMCCSSAA